MFDKILNLAETMLIVSLQDFFDYKYEFAEIVDFCINRDCYLALTKCDDSYCIFISRADDLYSADYFAIAKLTDKAFYIAKDKEQAFDFIAKAMKLTIENA